MKKHTLLLATGLAATLASASVCAEEFLDDRFYISPMGTYVHGGGDRNAPDGWGGSLSLGKMINELFNVELRGFYQGLGGGKGSWDLAGGSVDGLLFFTRDDFSPYAVLGLGGMNTNVDQQSNAHFFGEAGLGFLYKLCDNFSLRSDVRYRYDDDNDSIPNKSQFHDLVVNVGFMIPLGEAPHAAAMEPKPEPMAAINECTGDEDGDGVNDCEDRCPHTLAGAKVDSKGCLVSQTINLRGVNFHYDSAKLTTEAEGILSDAAQTLRDNPGLDIEVAGHTSSEGSDKYNARLSQRRAQSVVDYFADHGVQNTLRARGYGESHPIATNQTEEGRSQNRRVELVILNQ